ncbi:MAG: carbon-nitrogen hydrolase family protein, partial [Atribacterota bacterium]|nr:carbon-nitrogen hydrolase family protein [Atribacterota bacterium]
MGAIQFRVEKNKKENLDKAGYWINTVAQNGAEIVVLPEMFVCPYELECFPLFAERFPQGESLTFLAQTAKKHRIYLVGGSLPELFDGQVYNSSFIFNPQGELIALHRKIHLFDVDLEEIEFKESKIFSPGTSPTLFDTPWGKIGVMICYDVRFPELSRFYALKGAIMMVVPAAFNHV